MGFAEDVKAALMEAVKEAGSVNALATKLQINQVTLNRWVNDQRDPSLSGISTVMDYMDMTVCRRSPLKPSGLPGGHSSVADAIAESQRLARALEAAERRNAKLEGKVEALKEVLGAPPGREKNAG